MKKIIIALVAIVVLGGSASAQWNMGARINEGWGLGAEFSMQKLFSESNRLEIDLGLTWWGGPGYHHLYTTVTGAYHWTFPIVAGLQWFVGPGAQIGLHQETWEDNKDLNKTHIRLAAVGQVGIEYNFDFPLQLALDARPGVDLLGFGAHDFFVYSYAFSVRYRF
ncbi:MAG: outer membrane beta-barrel protein [Bacteroidales bacterium]|nr:outer membrane beta-barrel protein [Bacteroidales bacterium]MBP5645219.1 outer membrane beta-barrel protein [Bacteroidales bacterium]